MSDKPPVQQPFIPKSIAAGFGGCIGVGCALILIPLLIFIGIMILGALFSQS